MPKFLTQFVRSEDGPTAVEYAVMLALVIAACLTGVAALGMATKGSLENSSNQIGTMMGS